MYLLLTTCKDEAGDGGGSKARSKDLLSLGRILHLKLGIPRDHEHPDRLEFLDCEESSGAGMSM